MLNSEQAKAMFAREAILIGDSDAVLYDRAAQVLGEKAAEFAKDFGCKPGKYASMYGLGGDRQFRFLTLQGFMAAVTYANLEEAEQDAG